MKGAAKGSWELGKKGAAEISEIAGEIWDGDSEALAARGQAIEDFHAAVFETITNLPERALEFGEDIADLTNLVMDNPKILDALIENFVDVKEEILFC